MSRARTTRRPSTTGTTGTTGSLAAVLAPALAVTVLVAGCANGEPQGSAPASGDARSGVSSPATSQTTQVAPSITQSPTTPSPTAQGETTRSATTPAAAGCVEEVLSGMSVKQRVGQLFVAGVPVAASSATRAAAVDAASDIQAGGYLVMGRWTKGVEPLRDLNRRTGKTLAARADKVRPFVAADQEGGNVQPLRGTGFDRIPTALRQGRLTPSKLEAKWRDTWGPDLRRAGITVDFAPVADVVPASLGTANGPIGRYARQFGYTPGRVADHAAAAVRGLQEAGVLTTAKHFPGLGRVRGNTDVTSGVEDRTTRRDDPYLRPFRAAVDAGTTFVMISSARYPRIDANHKAVYSREVIGLLRDELGFDGIVVSDDLGVARQVSDLPYAQRALRFLAAGGQVVVVVGPPKAVREMARGVVAEARRSTTVKARVDAAARAVLTVKAAHGLIPSSVCG